MSERALHDSVELQQSLRLLNLYRLLVITLLVSIDILGYAPTAYGQLNPPLYFGTILAYAIISAGSSIATYWPPLNVHRFIPALSVLDVAAIMALIHTSGGISSGLGSLMMVSLAGSSLLMSPRTSLALASFASLALLIDETLGQLYGHYAINGFLHAGLIGMGIFLTSMLASQLAKRSRENEALAKKRGIDLANMAELNQEIISHMNSGVIALNEQDRVVSINQSAARMLGTDHDDVLGENVYELSSNLSQQLQTWKKRYSSNTLIRDAQLKEMRASFFQVGTHTLVYLDNLHEIGEQIHRDNLESLGRLTASIAHEIRNPLTSISHAAQLMEEEPDKTVRYRLTRMMLDNSYRIEALVQEVLNLSRKDAANPSLIALQDWLPEFLQEFTQSHADTALSLDLISQQKTTVCCDLRHLHQILWNLLSNAIVYGKHSQQTAQISIAYHLNPRNQVVSLNIDDQGPGIPEAQRHRLFEPFFTTGEHGTGLGLHISQQLCQLNQGQLMYLPLESGSRFQVQLPTA